MKINKLTVTVKCTKMPLGQNFLKIFSPISHLDTDICYCSCETLYFGLILKELRSRSISQSIGKTLSIPDLYVKEGLSYGKEFSQNDARDVFYPPLPSPLPKKEKFGRNNLHTPTIHPYRNILLNAVYPA